MKKTVTLLLLLGLVLSTPLLTHAQQYQNSLAARKAYTPSNPEAYEANKEQLQYILAKKQASAESQSTFWTYSKWIFSALGAAGIAGRFVFEGRANESYDAYQGATTTTQISSSRTDTESSVNMANTSLIVGAASAGFALLSFILDGSGDDAPSDYKYEPSEPEKKPEPTGPPVLAGNVSFQDENGDNIIEAGETAKITLTVENSGMGPAYSLQPKVSVEGMGISVREPATVSKLSPGDKTDMVFYVTGKSDVPDGSASVTVNVIEANRFDLDAPREVSFETRAFRAPKLIVADIAIDDYDNDRKISPTEPVDITARVQNIGEGLAKGVTAIIENGPNTFVMQGSNTSFTIGDLPSGEFEDVVFSVYTNRIAKDVDITVRLREERAAFNASEKLALEFNRIEKAAEELVVEGIREEKKNVVVSSLTIDIEKDIPELQVSNRHAVAVVIGNKAYENADVPMVDFADRDASLVREYLTKMLGYDETNIIYEIDASQAKFTTIFGSESDHKGRLFNYVRQGESDVFIYYSGHGAPDPESRQGYFVPSDSDPQLISLTGYPLETMYENLSKLDARSLTVVIDACFSGSSEKGMLLKNISPVNITIDNPAAALENGAVFTSAAANQVSTWYSEKKYSLFTYYFLKGLKGEADRNRNGELLLGELREYLDENVPYMARRLEARDQNPQVNGSDDFLLIEY